MAKLDDLINSTRKEIAEYSNYEKGWDGYDGEVFTLRIINAARETLSKISSFFQGVNLVPDELFPGPCSDGSIDIEIEYKGKRVIITHDYLDDEIKITTEIKGGTYKQFTKVSLYEGLRWLIS